MVPVVVMIFNLRPVLSGFSFILCPTWTVNSAIFQDSVKFVEIYREIVRNMTQYVLTPVSCVEHYDCFQVHVQATSPHLNKFNEIILRIVLLWHAELDSKLLVTVFKVKQLSLTSIGEVTHRLCPQIMLIP